MSRRGVRRGATAVLVAGLLSSAAGCSGQEPVATPTASTVPTASTSPTTAEAAPSASTSSAATPTPSTTSPSATATTPRATATSAATSTATAAPRWPKALGEPQQGEPVWAVYLAVGHSTTDAKVEKAVRQAAKVDYTAIIGDIACDTGASEALGLDPYNYWTGASLYFATKADAQSFSAAYTGEVAKPLGVVRVKLGCLD